MNRLLGQLNSAQPFTWQSFMWMSIGLLMLSPELLVESIGYSRITWQIILGVTLAIQGLLILVANRVFIRGRTFGQAAFTSWFFVLLVSSSFPIVFKIVSTAMFSIEIFPSIPVRFLTAAIVWMLITLAFSIAISETQKFHKELTALRSQLEDANELELQEKRTFEELRNTILSSVRGSLHKAFRQIELEYSSSQASSELKRLVDEVVRPLSSTVIQASAHTEEYSISKPVSNISFKDLLSRLVDSNPFEYKLMPIIVGMSSFFINTWLMGISETLLSSAVGILVLSGLLFISNTVFKFFKPHLGTFAAVFVVVFLMLSSAVINTVVSQSLLQLENIFVGILIMFVEFGVLLLGASMRTVSLERSKILTQLEDAIHTVEWMNSRLSQLIWVEKSRLARLVHGDIQARIIAVALEIDLVAPNKNELASKLKYLSESCQSALMSPQAETSLNAFVESLQQIWAHSLKIDVDIPSDFLRVAEEDATAKTSCIEIIREAVLNSVKHDQAKNVAISGVIPPTGERVDLATLELTITNDRALAAKTSLENLRANGAGHGTEIFNQLCTKWSLTQDAHQTTLKASLPWSTALVAEAG